MLDTNNSDWQKSKDQQQLSVSNRTAHDEQYPFLSEFSELVAKLSTEELLELTTYQQKKFAKALWEACNYGGSSIKCEKRLKEIYGSKWYEITSIDENMDDINDYYRWVLRVDHKKQWDNHRFWANISEDKILE